MSQESLQLLNLTQQATQQALSRIDQAMTRTAGLELEKSKAISDMSVKAAQLADEQRFNDFRIKQASYENAVRAKEFQLREKEFEFNSKINDLKFKEAEISLERTKKAEAATHFNGITQFTDQTVASVLSSTLNPDHARRYLEYKADALSSAMSFGSFDPAEYNKGAMKLIEGFKKEGPIETTEYKPEESYLLGQIDKTLQDTYERNRNPKTRQTKSMLAMQYVNGTESQRASILEKAGDVLQGDLGGLSIIADRKAMNSSRMKNLWDEYDSLLIREKAETNPAVKERIALAREEAEKEVKRLQEENRLIDLNIANGIFDISEVSTAPAIKVPQNPLDTVPGVAKQLEAIPSFVFGVNPNSSLENEGFTAAINNIKSIVGETTESIGPDGKPVKGVSEKGTEFEFVNMNWFMENSHARGKSPDSTTLGIIKRKINSGIESLYGEELEGLDDRIKVVVPKLIETIKTPTPSPVSETTASILSSIKEKDYIRRDSSGNPYVFFNSTKRSSVVSYINDSLRPPMPLSKKPMQDEIHSLEDIKQILSKVKSKEQIKEVKKDLYSSLSTAAFSYAISK